MQELISLFESEFKPYGTIPVIGLNENYIINKGYIREDIELLIKENKIEKFGINGYRMTKRYLKGFMGKSFKYIEGIYS